MVFHWPQITWIVCMVLGLILHGAKHGEPLEGKYNGFIKFIGAGISLWILWSGGFFTGGR